jgi:hypothetical protein
MRAISPHGRYSIQLVEAHPKRGVDATGTVVEYSDTKPIIAQFEQSGLMDWEADVALEKFNFTGLAEGVHPLSTVGVYDTELAVQFVADKKEREAKLLLIEQRLTELQEQFPSQFIIVSKPGAAKPWPSYDETPVEDIVGTMSLTGVTPETVVAYEMENEQRGEVLALMNDLQAEAEAEGIEVSLT